MDRRQRRQQQRHEEAVTSVGRRGAMSASRRGRFDHHSDGPVATVPVVDQAGCTARSCRSCVAVTLADAIALGCCPCAVVSLLGLALVKAPLAVGRRCVGRLRRRGRHKKRVRDVAGSTTMRDRREKVAAAPVTTTMAASAPTGVEPEPAWLEEMYRAGRWGFGRVSSSSSSSSGESPAVTS